MPTYISNTQADYVMADYEDLVILGSGSLTSVGTSFALTSTFGNAAIRIAGTLAGYYGAYISGAAGSYTNMMISSTGSVLGTSYGLWMQASEVRLTNAGSILAQGIGIAVGNTGTGTDGHFRLTNSGEISGSIGIYIVDGLGANISSTIVNHGTIHAGNLSSAAIANETAGGLDNITNYGTIAGTTLTNAAADTIINRGHILGNIITGTGDDLLDNTRGLDGQNVIDLGSGRDTAFLGLSDEHVGGGTGFDIASYRFGRAVKVNLADVSQNTGAAAGDFYSGVEQISGSERYGDILIGDGASNSLFGDGGNDTLSGGSGSDTLDGGQGADRLTGGLGNDTFRFFSDGIGSDAITDFSAVDGNNDRFLIEAPTLGLPAGTISGANFRARADNMAQDANDFFIFRTTDKTLWFDGNGSAAGGLRMLADLQASAVVTYQDIVILL